MCREILDVFTPLGHIEFFHGNAVFPGVVVENLRHDIDVITKTICRFQWLM